MSKCNTVFLIGNVGADPEQKQFASGKSCVNVRIATSDKWKDKDGTPREKTQWHSLKFFQERQQAVIMQYLGKGDKIFVQGAVEYRKQENNDGSTSYFTDIVVRDFELLGGGSQKNAGGHQEPVHDDDIPF